MSNCFGKDKCLLPRKKWRLANTYDLGTLMPENAKPPIFRQALPSNHLLLEVKFRIGTTAGKK